MSSTFALLPAPFSLQPLLAVSDSDLAAGFGILGAIFMLVMFFVMMVVTIIIIASMWKIFVKAGRPGWAAIVPVFNMMTLAEVVGKPNWWGLLTLIPFVQVVFFAILLIELAKSFGKETGFGVGMFLLPFVFLPILAFGKAQYLGAPVALPTRAIV